MPTIRDLVSALRRREGVQAAIVLGRDGLLIDGLVDSSFDAEGLAAHVPPLITAATDLGVTSHRGELGLVVMEYASGVAVAAQVSTDALLLILCAPSANLAALLYDLRRHRAQIAALV
jgi:predicted regulator of Ras-like GTPase activity (Roadblock/LC7/MglB family)